MSITSYPFILFVILFLILYYTVFRTRGQWVCLLLASMIFYALSGPKNLIYILVTAASCFAAAWKMGQLDAVYQAFRKGENPLCRKKRRRQDHALDINGAYVQEGLPTREERKACKAKITRKKRIILAAGLVINFGMLAVVKYRDVEYRGLMLPLGISFYIFQSTGYLIDCYNGKVLPEKNFLKYLLFVSFFPQLIQGPIGRYDKLAPQLEGQYRFDIERFKRSLLLTAFGILKKYAIANFLSSPISVLLDDHPMDIPGSGVVLAILMYSAQQYADFSGGIDIVTGVAGMFGVELAPNFRQPYFSISLGDFWRRWHISLGAWMRDYVFYPFALWKPMLKLGKTIAGHHRPQKSDSAEKKSSVSSGDPGVNQGRKERSERREEGLRKYLGTVIPVSIANILVFFLVGIWHGAETHYILWGLYNGAVIAASDIFKPVFQSWNRALHIRTESFGFRVFRILRTFAIVNVGWYFDRIYDFRTCVACFQKTFAAFHMAALPDVWSDYLSDLLDARKLLIILAALIIVFWHSVLREKRIDVYARLQARPLAVRWCAYYFIMVLIQFACDYAVSSSAFMYAYF